MLGDLDMIYSQFSLSEVYFKLDLVLIWSWAQPGGIYDVLLGVKSLMNHCSIKVRKLG